MAIPVFPSRRRPWRRLLASIPAAMLAALLALLVPLPPAWALGLGDLPPSPPPGHVIDGAGVLSRASLAELERLLDGLAADRVDARLVTLSRLDYGLDPESLGHQLLERWSPAPGDGSQAASAPLLLLLIDTQTRTAAVVADPSLERQLPPALLRSTARATMGEPLRGGERYHQAVVDALQRLTTVLDGGEDPGEPVVAEQVAPASNIPSHEETLRSNAFTWVVVLLVIGSVVPMVTWWVFSR